MATMCVWVRDQLEDLVDGELAGAREREVREHLADCEGCRAHHAEAASLPVRLAAVPAPEPPRTLVADVLRRTRGDRVGPLHLWGPLAVEIGLFLVALWYMSGPRGLYALVQHTAEDAGSLVGWGFGQADLPAPVASDVFLLAVFALLLVTTLYHLTLLSRQGQLS